MITFQPILDDRHSVEKDTPATCPHCAVTGFSRLHFHFLANVNYVTFAIRYRNSVCRLSVDCDVGAPYSAG